MSMTTESFTNVLYNNCKKLLEKAENTFYFKILLLFGIYLVTAHIFDGLDNDFIKPTFEEKPYTYVQINNTTSLKIVMVIFFMISSRLVYNNIIKPLI